VSNINMTQAPIKPLLKASKLYFSHPGQKLFTDFSVSLPPGITLIRGGDGRGKTTLLRLLAGVLPAQSGQLQINGIDLQTQAENYTAQVFWVEPRSDAFDQLTAIDYVASQRSRYPDFDAAVLANMTHGLGLQEHMHKQLFMLSTGSKRKVFLAAAFASGAAVMLLDEPFAALDAASIAFILAWLKGAASDIPCAWVIADYVAPEGLPLVQVIDVGD
jgi:ABC-type multidrug transport system ATPase subunit